MNCYFVELRRKWLKIVILNSRIYSQKWKKMFVYKCAQIFNKINMGS